MAHLDKIGSVNFSGGNLAKGREMVSGETAEETMARIHKEELVADLPEQGSAQNLNASVRKSFKPKSS